MLGKIKRLLCFALTALAVSASAFIPSFQPLESDGNVLSQRGNEGNEVLFAYDAMNHLTNSTLTASTISTSLTVSSSH
jgi:hypothetical protein